MDFKQGVEIGTHLSPYVWLAMLKVDVIHQTLHGYGITVTSVTDGNRLPGSLHFWGFAFDIRTRHLTDTQAAELWRKISQILGPGFDVVRKLDPPHIHIEFDPRKMADMGFSEWRV